MGCETNKFLTGPEARMIARNSVVVFKEICAIQQSILEAINNCPGPGKYSTIVPEYITDGMTEEYLPDTPMTSTLDTDSSGSPDSINYYLTHTNQRISLEISDQLSFVQKYFTDLGYNIQIQVNPRTMNTLQWYIMW